MTTDLSSKAHLNNYDPSSFGWPHAVPDLVPFVFQGTNFGQCAKDAHDVFMALLTELVPHIPGGINFGPHDDWAYSTTDDLPDGSWSFHRYGIAFDLNWRENPMGDYVSNPHAGERGAIPHDVASAVAHRYGCEYGGDWSGGEGHRGYKDFMHFELHLSPADARAFTPQLPTEDDDMAWETPLTKAELKLAFGTDKAPHTRGEVILLTYKKLAAVQDDVVADLAVDKHDDAQDATP